MYIMKKKIGEPCFNDNGCYNKNCVNSVCTKRPRKRKKKIGEDCLKDKACYTRKCYRMGDQSIGKCVGKSKRKKIGEYCNDSRECYNKNCINNVCSRKKRVYKKLGVECNNDNDCYSRNCRNNVCTSKKKRISPLNSATIRSMNRPNTTIKPMSMKQNTMTTRKKKYTLTPKERIIRYSPTSRQKTPPDNLHVNKYFEIPSNQELLKLHQDMNEIGINEKDFYYDPCYFLNGLNKLMEKSNFKKYENKMYLLLPIIYPKNDNFRENNYKTNKMNNTEFYKQIRNSELGGNTLDICFEQECYIAQGSFGKVYKSKFNNKDIVIKSPISNYVITEQNEKHNEVFDENLIQSVLYCALRGQTNNIAKIPKIEYMARLYMPGSGMKIITGIERLNGDMNGFFATVISKASPSEADILIKDLLLQVCKLLELLQDRYNFHHRDLHAGNIMYKNIGSSTRPVYRWYMIDFGYAYLEKDGKKYHEEAIGIYPRYPKPNFAHDFRIFFAYFDSILSPYIPDSLLSESSMIKFMLDVSVKLFKNFAKDTKRFHWHDSYRYFDYALPTDNYTNPRTLRKILESRNI